MGLSYHLHHCLAEVNCHFGPECETKLSKVAFIAQPVSEDRDAHLTGLPFVATPSQSL